ncbi:hypothetical protein BV25DRAFT_1996290 [Artomyces pyxidatus]|uniref:Uncharacterized protein n=1 Tax=Artomyces pyxidatus TaxID=48021 RepID=A0ACB8SFX9_9AGAM|nr:hypothetical protein BV25DRAFT_1996290 [Artomyces pyxidatus]
MSTTSFPSSTTSFTPPSLSTASPDPTPSINLGAGNSGASTSIYLYTFVGTLLLILTILAIIVLRIISTRRNLAAAIRAGTYILEPGERPPKPLDRPQIWEIYEVRGEGLGRDQAGLCEGTRPDRRPQPAPWSHAQFLPSRGRTSGDFWGDRFGAPDARESFTARCPRRDALARAGDSDGAGACRRARRRHCAAWRVSAGRLALSKILDYEVTVLYESSAC